MSSLANRLAAVAIAAMLIPALSTSVFAQTASKTIVISDIDDTIELSQIRSASDGAEDRIKQAWAFVTGLFSSSDAFVGMPSLYLAMATNGREFRYVSGTPKIFARIPEKFLQTMGFPRGELTVRPSFKDSTEEFKVSRITQIMLSEPDARFILIGDNGERDVQAYQLLMNDPRFTTKIAAVYIHRLYSPPIGQILAPGQIPYFTTADLALELLKDGDVSEAQVGETLKLVETGLQSRFENIRKRSLPDFVRISSSEIDGLSLRGENAQDGNIVASYARIIENLRKLQDHQR